MSLRWDLRETGRESAREMRWRELGGSLEGGAWDGGARMRSRWVRGEVHARSRALNARNHREKKERRELVAG